MLPEAASFKKNWLAAQKTQRASGGDFAFVYVHIEADTGNPFYVGIGERNVRPWDFSARSEFHKKVKNKYGVRVEIIQDNLSWESACFWEVRLIKALRAAGYRLVNLTNGGEGFDSDFAKEVQNRPDVKKRQSEAKIGDRNPMKRPDVCRKVSDSLRALGDDHPSRRPEVREKLSAIRSAKGDAHHAKRPEVREKIGRSNSKILKEKGAWTGDDNPKTWMTAEQKTQAGLKSVETRKAREALLSEEDFAVLSFTRSKSVSESSGARWETRRAKEAVLSQEERDLRKADRSTKSSKSGKAYYDSLTPEQRLERNARNAETRFRNKYPYWGA